jgi:dihydrofolate reductase
MRLLTSGLFASIDGVVESPNLFQFDSFDPELGALMGAMIDEVDTAVMGRAGYEEWSQYWPSAPADDPFGAFINPIEKFVASTTLTGELGWNARLIEGDVESFLADLKQTEGGRISLASSTSSR